EMLGGRGNVLAQAVAYSQIFFGGAVLPWLMNSMAAILRGTGNMKLPSAMILNSAICQIILGGTLGLGLGPIPQFGMRGVAAGSVGIAPVPMIGMAIGAERIARARRIAWTARLVSFISVGAIGTLIAIFPDFWVDIFTNDASVRAASRQYLSTVAPCYAFIGL